jgi:hypothetical protein
MKLFKSGSGEDCLFHTDRQPPADHRRLPHNDQDLLLNPDVSQGLSPGRITTKP